LVFADNRTHRIHHSVEDQHVGHNFGVLTTLWDRLFGTYWAPQPGEWPDTGVAGLAEAETVIDYLLRPFRKQPSEIRTSPP
jgi:sterol desaturase/sphingolipid hydroxylase (fatty acid hydroxylase superfamily)